jgi:hypothetical protein
MGAVSSTAYQENKVTKKTDSLKLLPSQNRVHVKHERCDGVWWVAKYLTLA